MIVVIDNYDSFVHNLARYCRLLGHHTHVVRNDAITIAQIAALNPSHIVISPGPCTPTEAGISIEVIDHFATRLPILGVCLGHQAIGQCFGGNVVRAEKPIHGKAIAITHQRQDLFKDLPTPLTVGCYHSLIVEKNSLPDELMITAENSVGEIMALQHREFPVFGVQFHPESIMSELGMQIFKNFFA